MKPTATMGLKADIDFFFVARIATLDSGIKTT